MADAFQTDAFQTDAFQTDIADAFSLDAVIQKTQASAFSLDAVIKDEQAGSFTLDAIVRDEQTSSATLDAVLLKTQAGSASLDAIIGESAVETFGDFTLDAWITGAVGQHSRATDHFDAQPDAVITALGVPGYVDGTLLSEVLADLFARATDLVPTHIFGLDAVIEAATPSPMSDVFSLDAWIAHGSSFGLSAILRRVNGRSFGLSAVIVEEI